MGGFCLCFSYSCRQQSRYPAPCLRVSGAPEPGAPHPPVPPHVVRFGGCAPPFQVRALLDGQFCAVPGIFLIAAILFLLTFHIKCFSFSEMGNSVSGFSLHQVLCYFQVILFLRGTSNGIPVVASCRLHALGTLDPHMLSPPLPPQLTPAQRQ